MKYLIAGLGNIGPEYTNTRHNIGFMVLDELAKKEGITMQLNRHAYTSVVRYKGRELTLLMPTTYMNLSGKAVNYHLKTNNIPLQNLLVVTDDLALPFGKLRLRAKGSHGGHNGLRNIEEVLGTADFARLRFGVGNNFPKGRQVDYVLSSFTDEEFELLPAIIGKAIEGILSFTTIGLDRTMSVLNQ